MANQAPQPPSSFNRAPRSPFTDHPEAYLSRSTMRMMAASQPVAETEVPATRYASPLTRLLHVLARQAAREAFGGKARS